MSGQMEKRLVAIEARLRAAMGDTFDPRHPFDADMVWLLDTCHRLLRERAQAREGKS